MGQLFILSGHVKAKTFTFLAEDGSRPVQSRDRYSVSISGRDGRTLAAAPGRDESHATAVYEPGQYRIGHR